MLAVHIPLQGEFIMTLRTLVAFVLLGISSLPLNAQETGLRTIQSTQNAPTTLAKLDQAIKSRGMKVFAHIDHAAAAKELGLTMPASVVVIFGNPKNGTPNFLKRPTLAIDLPLKILVWDNAAGKTFVTYNTGNYVLGTLFGRHGLKPPSNIIAATGQMLEGLASSAAN
jgi:uncharacterized protein (DUF302 family)